MKDKRGEILNVIKSRDWSVPTKDVLSELEECVSVGVSNGGLRDYKSKIGGAPDFVSGTGWPAENIEKKRWSFLRGKSIKTSTASYSFIAQIDMAELATLNLAENFPEEGLLSFFYSQKKMVKGDKPGDRYRWKVMYQDCDVKAAYPARFPEDLPEPFRYKESNVELSLSFTLSRYSNHREPLQINDFEDDFLVDLVEGEYVNQILGPACNIEGNQLPTIAHVTDYLDDFSGSASDWILLLQVDSVEESGMNWLNNGMLNFWITVEDLNARCFDKVWCTLQSY